MSANTQKEIELYGFRYIRELIQEEMIDAVILDDRQRKSLHEQLEMVLPKISAIIRLAYEAGWNEGYDLAEEEEEKRQMEVDNMLKETKPS